LHGHRETFASEACGMTPAELFFCVGLLVLCGCFHVPAHENTTKEEKYWRETRGHSIHVYHGEPRPKGARRVTLRSQWPSTAELTRLVTKYGYPASAAVSAIYSKGCGFAQDEDGEQYQGRVLHPEHPYVPASPELRGTHVGGFHAKTVTRAIEKTLPGISEEHAKGVFETIALRRNDTLVAASLGIKVTTLYQYKWRVMCELRKEGSVMLSPDPEKRGKKRQKLVRKELSPLVSV
jgi:hypothetical protein